MTQTKTKDKATEGARAAAPAIPDATGELVPMTKEMITAWLAGDDLTVEDESDDWDYETAVRILGADNAADVLKQNDIRKGRDLVGTSFSILSVAWRKSTKSEDGKGRYAVCELVDADGVPFTASFGMTKVVLQLRWAQLHGALPWQVELTSATTSNNRTVYELVKPLEPF
jgi:hypothetical protein